MRYVPAIVMFATLGLAVFAAPPATQPASKPTTKPTTKLVAKPKQKFTLMNGAVRFMVPAEWTESDRSDDDRNVQYHSPDGKAWLLVGVTPQEYPIPQHNWGFVEKMKASLLANMKQYHEEHQTQVLFGPKSETDDRFLLRIHDRIKDGHAQLDQVHLYRAAGLDLLMVTSVVKSENKDEIKAFHTIGEDMCLSMVLGAAEKKKETR